MKKNRCGIIVSLVALMLLLSMLTGCGGKTETVTFTLTGDSIHGEDQHGAFETWIDKAGCEIKDGDTVLEIINAAMEKGGYTFADESYIYSVTAPDGLSLDAGSNGENSGWLYAVNGVIPTVGMAEYVVQDGDHVLLRYVDDFNTEVDWETSTFID